jgi:transglutaminase-like putative cysteine protease
MFSFLIKKYAYAVCYCVCVLLSIGPAFAGDPIYPAMLIPDSLKKNAHAVTRLEEITIKINDPRDVRMTMHYIVTVLDAEGEKFGYFTAGYDNLTEIRSIKGALYDALGLPIKKLKQSDIQDLSGTGGDLMTDDRIKRHKFYHNLYPHTVEYEVEMRYNHTFYLPTWRPQEDESLAVEQSKLTVITPKDYILRYKALNYKGEPVQGNDGSDRTYSWEAKNLCAVPDEPYAPHWNTRSVSVLLAAASFEMEKYKGTMNTWEEYGKFSYILNQGRDVLPDNIKQTVHQLTDGLEREQKIAKLYEYLQQHTRYISVQLGIGGWQTFDAAYVAAKGYGDCKALSNYMCAMLKEAGIKASCVLVYAGEDKNDVTPADFPSSSFNHVIVCVPNTKDTTWLECTNSTVPLGYMGEFTGNRSVLIVDENGGKLVRTPAYSMEQNVQTRHVVAKVEESGEMTVKANSRYSALQTDDLHDILNSLTKEKLMEGLKQVGFFPSYEVKRYDWKETKSAVPYIDEQIEITARNYATITGKRMFIEPNLMNKTSRRLSVDSVRRADIYLSYSYRDIDTVTITIPEGYTPEAVPPPIALQSPFGAYSSKVSIEGNVITYIRSIDHKGGTYPASSYGELAKFYNSMYKADRSRIVLVKK